MPGDFLTAVSLRPFGLIESQFVFLEEWRLAGFFTREKHHSSPGPHLAVAELLHEFSTDLKTTSFPVLHFVSPGVIQAGCDAFVVCGGLWSVVVGWEGVACSVTLCDVRRAAALRLWLSLCSAE